jgi:adenylate cyclase
VILTWKLNDGLRNENCLNAFYNFKQQLANKQHYYHNKYQCKPFFKAGVNTGLVTATEIGKYKKEIVYHGDTMNTTARIQSKCNEFNRELLISEQLKIQLESCRFKFENLGSIALRGKERDVLIYAVLEV